MGAPAGNQYAIGNNGGRPPHFDTVEDLIAKADEYFVYIEGEYHWETHTKLDPETKEITAYETQVWDRPPEPCTVTGLCLYLGFSSRSSMVDYAKKSDEFSHVIKRLRTRVEHAYEKQLYADRPTGAIFALKNMGWSDKVDLTSGDKPLESGTTKVVIVRPKDEDA